MLIELIIEGVLVLLRLAAIIAPIAAVAVVYFWYRGNKIQKESQEKSQSVLQKCGRGDIRIQK